MKSPAPTAAISKSTVNKHTVLWNKGGVLADGDELHYQSWLETLTVLSMWFDRDKFHLTLRINNTGIM
jgi:hypothetical protein